MTNIILQQNNIDLIKFYIDFGDKVLLFKYVICKHGRTHKPGDSSGGCNVS